MTSNREPPELIGTAPSFQDALAHASAAAILDRPLLILGERGAGKELIAARIHFLSRRWEGPFIKLNCAAMTDELLDSELFGHEPGAFTGAQKRHRGRFERADGGTLFLDEIASASLRVQEKLLRIIEYGEYERVGGEQTLTANVRIVAAANVDLKARAASGKFRADLLDRLAFDVVAAPPLRERKEDIPLLAAHFAGGLAREMEARYEGFTPDAMAAFARHSWPGNVRELKNAAERSFYRWLASGNSGPIGEAAIDPFEAAQMPPENLRGDIGPAHASLGETPAAPADLRKELDGIERRWVEETLVACGGNQRLAGERLSLTYDQIRGLVRKHGLAGKR